MEFVGLSSVNDLKSIKRNGETVRCRHENYTWWLWFMMVSLSLLVYKKKLLGNSRMGIFGKPWNMALSDGLYHQNHHWKMGRMSIISSTWGAIKTISTNQPLSFGYCSWLRRYDQVAPSWHMESWSLSLDAGIFDRRSIHRYILLYMIFLWLFSKYIQYITVIISAYLFAYFLVFYLQRIIYFMQKSLMDLFGSSDLPRSAT